MGNITGNISAGNNHEDSIYDKVDSRQSTEELHITLQTCNLINLINVLHKCRADYDLILILQPHKDDTFRRTGSGRYLCDADAYDLTSR